MLTVKFGEATYELPLEEALQSLTGAETMMVEDFLGGWDKFRSPSNVTRSTIVIVWLAKRHAKQPTTFEEIAKTPGLVFGDAFDVLDEEDERPFDGSARSSSEADSPSSLETSEPSGPPSSEDSTE